MQNSSLKALGDFCLKRQKSEVAIQDVFAAAVGHWSILGWEACDGLGAAES